MIEFPPFRIDAVNQCLWRCDDTGAEIRIEMRPKPYAVLRYLAERAGRLVTQEELLKALWPQAYVQPEVLKSHVLSVRSALGDNSRSPKYIQTLPRRGYRFIAATAGTDGRGRSTEVQMGRHLVGRNTQLRQLWVHLQSAVEGRRQMVFLTGEAGIGKSALVEEFQARAMADSPGLRIAIGQCAEGHGGKEAYYPILEALGSLCLQSGGDAIVEMLADKAPTLLVQFPALLKPEHRIRLQRELTGATRERMLREMSEAIEEVTADAPLLLVLSDLHWVDFATVDLLAALARRNARARLMIVCTYRPADLALMDHPLRGIKQELMAHRLCSEIALQRLQRADVINYLDPTASGADAEGTLSKLIHDLSDGNPLFMVALLNYMASRGLATRVDETWRAKAPISELDVRVPDEILDMIEFRIDRLSAQEQRALEAASVLGATFGPEAGAAAAAMKIDDFEYVCDRLARRREILTTKGERSGDGEFGYQFSHDLYREVLYKRQPLSRRSRIHFRRGEWLESRIASGTIDAAPILAHHFEEGASWERAVKYLGMSAEIHMRRYAHRESAAILFHALELVNKLPESQGRVVEIGLLRTLCSSLEASLDLRTIQTYDTLLEKTTEYGMLDEQVRAILNMVGTVAAVDHDRSIQLLDHAIEIAPRIEDPAVRASALAGSHLSRVVLQGWSKGDEVQCRLWIDEVRRQGGAADLAPLLAPFSWMLLHLSLYREALGLAEEALANFDQNPGRQRTSLAPFARNLSFMYLGDWGGALKCTEEVAAIMSKNGYPLRATATRMIRPRISLHAGDFAGAASFLESVLASFVAANHVPLIRDCKAEMALADIGLGHVDRALGLLGDLDAEMSNHRLPADQYSRPMVEWGFVEAFLAVNDLANADLHCRRWLRDSVQLGEVTWQGMAWEAGARIAMAKGDLGEAKHHLSSALAAISGYEAPLASWKIRASAAEVEKLLGHDAAAAEHRELGIDTVRVLAAMLPETEPVRAALLSSSRVQRLLAAA